MLKATVANRTLHKHSNMTTLRGGGGGGGRREVFRVEVWKLSLYFWPRLKLLACGLKFVSLNEILKSAFDGKYNI